MNMTSPRRGAVDALKLHLKHKIDGELIEQLSVLDYLTEEDTQSIKHIINSFVAKNQVKNFISEVNYETSVLHI